MGEKISRIFVLNFILEKFISMMSINYIDRDIKETKIARGRATTLWIIQDFILFSAFTCLPCCCIRTDTIGKKRPVALRNLLAGWNFFLPSCYRPLHNRREIVPIKNSITYNATANQISIFRGKFRSHGSTRCSFSRCAIFYDPRL